jgi:alpha-1,3-glucosyltransferase
MLGYHVHEKAILTAIIPMTLLLATNSRRATRLYIRTCTFGLFAILPLLYRPEELLLKAVIFIAWMCGVIYILENEEEQQGHHLGYGKNRAGGGAGSFVVGVAGHQNQNEGGRKKRSAALTKVDLISFAILGSVLLFMEIIHPIVLMPSGRMEFLPLMATSVICATGLAWCWLDSYSQMIVVGDVAQRSA